MSVGAETWEDTVLEDQDPASPGFRWVAALSTPGPLQSLAMDELHGFMLRAAAHQVRRMSSEFAGMDQHDVDVLINQSADEAMVSVIRKLDTFEGRSRFTTWAYKFAILQAASDVHRTVWRDREVALDEVGPVPDVAATPAEHAEAADLGRALTDAIASVLTPHQRRVVTALLLEHVPIDVLADRLGTSRNALYKALHDARVRLRSHLVGTGHLPDPATLEGGAR